MDNWDDFRILLAVTKGGSITAGASQLGLNQSTVSRRLHAFESRLGRQLFKSTKTRNHLTVFGESCVKSARRLEEEMVQLNQELRVNEMGFEGAITVHTDDVLSDRLLLSVCSGFLEKFPKINLRVSRGSGADPEMKTDIALYATNNPKDEYFGRRLAVATLASYASHEYLKRFRGQPGKMAWLNWDDGSGSPTWPQMSPKVSDEMCRLRSTSVESLIEAARLGLGATILPCFIGEIDDSLSRIDPQKIITKREVWVFVQPKLTQVPKIRKFTDYLYEEIRKKKNIIESA